MAARGLLSTLARRCRALETLAIPPGAAVATGAAAAAAGAPAPRPLITPSDSAWRSQLPQSTAAAATAAFSAAAEPPRRGGVRCCGEGEGSEHDAAAALLADLREVRAACIAALQDSQCAGQARHSQPHNTHARAHTIT